MTETDALVVGAGPVGLFQIFQLGLLDIQCHAVDALPHTGGQCAELYPDKPIYDVPGVVATSGRELAAALTQQITPFTRAGTAQLHLGQQTSQLAQRSDGRFEARTTAGLGFIAKTVFIAAGAGAFVPRKLRVDGMAAFEGRQLFYQPPAALDLRGLHIVIQGDDDRALAWAIGYASETGPASVTLMHRREVFSATPERVQTLNDLRAAGRVQFIAGQITAPATTAEGETTRLSGLQLALPDGSSQTLPCDLLLAALGLSPQLGPIADWGLELQRKQLPVDTETFQTRIPGIFAVGDINTYPGKKKLLVCGFHECVLAAFAAAAIVHPGKPHPLQYTTTSSHLHQLLGVGNSQAA